jgi:C-1 hydroxylase
MSVEENKSIIRRYVQAWNRGDLKGLSDYWSSEMLHHTRTKSHGLAETINIVGSFMNAFPDLRWQIDDIVAEGDKVVTRMTAEATHTGSYLGMPPTGKKINCSVVGIARIDNGKIIEHWGVTDELAMLSQIGVSPQEYLTAMS